MMARRETLLAIHTSVAAAPKCGMRYSACAYKFWLKLIVFGRNPYAIRVHFN